MMKKYCFNMIEIILAISIIAIGISSVMALFTAGIKTGNATVASSNMPDVSESLLNHIRQKVEDCRTKNGWKSDELAKVAPTSAVEGAGDFAADLVEGSNTDIIKGDNKGCFLYRQLTVSQFDNTGKPSAYVPAFSAVATVKRIENSLNDIYLSNPLDPSGASFTETLKDDDNTTGKDMVDNFRVVLQVTISYPADLPADQRESKVHIMEVFNDKYNRFVREEEGE
ncbi:MAG: hypothetical protein E7048_03210 [Lentisphaerae bacterium]|nr:hypothetical protein [Lentisphaerota bacterium]